MTVLWVRPCFIAVLALASASSSCSGKPSGPPVPSPQHCVRAWNEDPPSVAIQAEDANVKVYAWTDKAQDEGCGIVIVLKETGAWTTHSSVLTRSVAIVPAQWDAVSGEEWGEDSPDGDVLEGFNGSLDPRGRIASG
jgi:hypothetical protein